MVLIVESGATKTDWCALHEDGSVARYRTAGLNPMVLGAEKMREIMASAVPAVNPDGRTISKVFYYGAGMVSEEAAAPVLSALYPWCPFADIEWGSDLVAAARALFGNDEGVAAILGTGSNSCLWSGGKVARNIRPGGYVLGDEGGGASIGRMLLADYIKGLVPADLAGMLEEEYRLDYSSVVTSVYRGEAPSGYLASFARFVVDNKDHGYAGGLLDNAFRSFIERSLSRYGCPRVGVVGSLGCACKDILEPLGKEYGLDFVRFVSAPADELIKFHRNVI